MADSGENGHRACPSGLAALEPLTGCRWRPYRERHQVTGTQLNGFEARAIHHQSSQIAAAPYFALAGR